MYISIAITASYCCEILLKYQLQREGKKIIETHKLYELYRRLNDETKEQIGQKYKEKISIINMDKNPDYKELETIELLFKKYNDAYNIWRYIYEEKDEKKVEKVYPDFLHHAALSIYEQTNITAFEYNVARVPMNQ